MALFDFLFGKKDKPQQRPVKPVVNNTELLSPITVSAGITLPRALADQWQIIEQTKRTSIAIKATPDDQLTHRQSKFGHYPCLPNGFAYPTGPEGEYLYPLAQINCSECPALAGFPSSGYLQFYISPNDMSGLDLDDQQTQKGFRVLYFEEAAVTDIQEDFSFLDNLLTTEYSPVYKPHRLQFSLQEEYAGMNDYQGAGDPGSDIIALCERYPAINDELMEALFDNLPSTGHKMGGYAYFTQVDPRMYHPEWRPFILLFQMDTDDEIMWGDSGVANFFIDPADLAKKDFTKVVYNWDCC